MLKFTFNLSGAILAFALCVRSCGGILMSRGSKVNGEDSHFLLLLIGLISLLVRLFLIHSTVRCSLRPYLPCSPLKYLTNSKTLNSGPWWKLLSRAYLQTITVGWPSLYYLLSFFIDRRATPGDAAKAAAASENGSEPEFSARGGWSTFWPSQ